MSVLWIKKSQVMGRLLCLRLLPKQNPSSSYPFLRYVLILLLWETFLNIKVCSLNSHSILSSMFALSVFHLAYRVL